jgi:dolichyl-phosphate-mannose--protein O-mannosyl transferase
LIFIKFRNPVKCNDIIRLEHISTGKNLHSHKVASPQSNQQEVSGFGNKGEGDTCDNWKVICEEGQHKDNIWNRGQPIKLYVWSKFIIHIYIIITIILACRYEDVFICTCKICL